MNSIFFNYLQQREPVLGSSGDVTAENHWRLARDDRGIAWLLFDRTDSGINTLGSEVLNALDKIMEQLEREPPKALLLRSAKASGFCLGADIGEFSRFEGETLIVEQIQRGKAAIDRLAALSFPTLALIHGHCLGGGLELALACDYRLALPDARLGLPEILLGLHPGLGGTVRLPRLIDPLQAMTLMLTGKSLDARQARRAGLVDDVIEERHLQRALDSLLAGRLQSRGGGWRTVVLNSAPVRHLVAPNMRKRAAAKVNPDHYPAPSALIDLWQQHGGNADTMAEQEIRSFAGLLDTDTAQNLIRVFFLQEKMKRLTRNGADPVRQVHVVGAGAMGGDIAAWCAYKGLQVSLYDPQMPSLSQAMVRAGKLCRSRHLNNARTREVLDRLIPDYRNLGVEKADLVIEAVPEKLELKHQVYAELEPRLNQGALLATNTSSIPLEELQRALKRPERFVGLHFFNPVAMMPLVEVVAAADSSDDSLARALAFVGQIDRQPAQVSSTPGFLVNRALTPYLLEAVNLMEEGVTPETLDAAAERFGMPMGPVELADRVGLDICLDVADMLSQRLDQPMAAIPDRLRNMVERGDLGLKSGRGYYAWERGVARKAAINREVSDDPGLQDRLLLPLLNTCMACLRENVIGDADVLDAAIIFGTGFAPFRGGPLHYARQRGYADIVAKLDDLCQRHGERFRPDPGWTEANVTGTSD